MAAKNVEAQPIAEELHRLQEHRLWLLVLGVGFILSGAAAISVPMLATIGIVTLVGILMLIGGVAQIVSSFSSSDWGGVVLHLTLGILYAVTGFFVLENRLESAAGLTLLLAAFFVVGGVFRIVFALRQRFPTWGWTLLSGAVTLTLGIVIWRQFPESALWLIGLLVGIDLIFNGWMWVMLAFAVHRLPQLEEPAKT